MSMELLMVSGHLLSKLHGLFFDFSSFLSTFHTIKIISIQPLLASGPSISSDPRNFNIIIMPLTQDLKWGYEGMFFLMSLKSHSSKLLLLGNNEVVIDIIALSYRINLPKWNTTDNNYRFNQICNIWIHKTLKNSFIITLNRYASPGLWVDLKWRKRHLGIWITKSYSYSRSKKFFHENNWG